MLLNRDRAQLLVIDIQEKLAPAVLEHDLVILRAVRLITAARRLGAPITVSEQYPRGLGPTVAAVRESLGNEAATLEKTAFSCWRDGGLRSRIEGLAKAGRGQIVVAGMEAHICVAQTALDLAAAGLDVFVAADAVSARAQRSADLALARLRHAGCAAIDHEMAIFEWLGDAAAPEFRELQQLVK